MTFYAMKPIIALLLCAFSAAAQVPPMPPEPVPKGHKSMADAENEAVRLRAAKARQAQIINSNSIDSSLIVQSPKPFVNPATEQTRQTLAWAKLHPVKPAPMTPHPTLGQRSPRDASKSPPMRRRKP